MLKRNKYSNGELVKCLHYFKLDKRCNLDNLVASNCGYDIGNTG